MLTTTEESEEAGNAEKSTILNIGLWSLWGLWGLWGWPPSSHPADILKANLDLGHKIRELGGRKWLIATTYYTEPEFWSIYGRKWYDAL